MYKASMADIKQLRARSGAGIKDCKNALNENGGDIQAAKPIGGSPQPYHTSGSSVSIDPSRIPTCL